MEKGLEIWVFGDYRDHFQNRLTFQVLHQARAISKEYGRVSLILLGHKLDTIVNHYISSGIPKILLLDEPELSVYRADLFTDLLCELIQEYRPDIFLLGASEFTKELAPRLAKRLEVGLCADCISLEWEKQKDRLVAYSPAFGGSFLAKIVWKSKRPYMATLIPGFYKEIPSDEKKETEIIRLKKKDIKNKNYNIKIISSIKQPRESINLEDAKIVVAGGRGVKNLEGFNYIRELALLLGGEVGATRPAVDAHWASEDHLIGQTGKSIKPQLLITCGTSGAIQYITGIRKAGTVVAINRDRYAPIFKIADIGIVADSLSFLPAFIQEVKSQIFREITDLYRISLNSEKQQRPISFGQRIKKLREDRKLNISGLAKATGQTPEFIEDVESDRVTPPVSFLLQLGQALKIDPSHFLTDQEKREVEGKRQEGFIKRTQNYSYRTLTPGAANKHLRAFMVTIEPRQYHKMVEYKHPGEEFIFVFKGELEITLGEKVFYLKQGETIHFDSEIRHKLRNPLDEKCELIVTLYTP